MCNGNFITGPYWNAKSHLEKVIEHEIMIGLLMSSFQSDIFIHVEGLHIFEANLSGFIIFHQFGIHF